MGSSNNLVCIPGQRLCLAEEHTVAGQGTYERLGYIYSMLAGIVNIKQKLNVSFVIVSQKTQSFNVKRDDHLIIYLKKNILA